MTLPSVSLLLLLLRLLWNSVRVIFVNFAFQEQDLRLL